MLQVQAITSQSFCSLQAVPAGTRVTFISHPGLTNPRCMTTRSPSNNDLIGLAMHAGWPDKRLAVHCMITGALMHGGYLGFVFWSIWKGMPAGVSALIVGLQPLVTALLAGIMLGERITARHWTGLLVGLAGVVMVVWPKFTLSAEGITPVTVAANVFAMLSITFGSLYQKRFMGSVDLRTGNALQFIGATVVLLLAALATESFNITWNGPVIFGMTCST